MSTDSFAGTPAGPAAAQAMNDNLLQTSLGDVHGLLLRMAQCHALEQLFSLVAETLGRLPGMALCRIWLLEQSAPPLCAACRQFYDCTDHRQCLRLVVSSGRSRDGGKEWTALDGRFQRFPLGRGKVGCIAASGQAFLVDEVSPDMPWVSDPQWIAEERIQTFLGLPLMHKGAILGVLALFSRQRHGSSEMRSLRLVADYLAVSIANAQAFEELARLKRCLEIENSHLQVDMAPSEDALLGDSAPMQNLRSRIRQVAYTSIPVLITGEVGSGRGSAAMALHRQSAVASGPLVRVDCASLSEESFETDFFGSAAAAGAGLVGFLEAARHGTLFFDNVQDIPQPVQRKLLAILRSREFRKGGEPRPQPLHTRFLASADMSLPRRVAQGSFREDLFYQLNVFALEVPSLRERKEDIPLLSRHIMATLSQQFKRPGLSLSEECHRLLQAYDWPGNIRELQNVLMRIVLTAADDRVDAAMLSSVLRAARQDSPVRDEGVRTEAEMVQLARENLQRALAACHNRIYGNSGAARLLGISPTTLCSRLKKYGIVPERGVKRGAKRNGTA